MMDTRCHQSSFCFIKNEGEAWKITSLINRELNAVEDISILFNGKTICKMQSWWYISTTPALKKAEAEGV
jgi:hypothetical protein